MAAFCALCEITQPDGLGSFTLSHRNALSTDMSTLPNPDNLHVIYISRLAPDEDYRAFAAVSRSARARNPSLGIGGALLFDGESFCQWLHGPADSVNRLVTTIALDRRHVDFTVLQYGGSNFTPFHHSWCSGFVPPFSLGAMKNIRIGTTEALPLFMSVLAQADV